MPVLAALPDLALCVVAGFLLVLALALFALKGVLTGVFSHIPGIGGIAAGAVGALVDRAANDVLNASGTVWKTSAVIFRSIGSWARGMWAGAVIVWQETLHTMENIVGIQIPAVANEAASHVYHYSQQVLAQAARWYHDALAYSDAWGARLTSMIADVANTAAKDAASAFDHANAVIGERVAGLSTDIDTAARHGFDVAWKESARDLGALKDVIGHDFPDISALLPWAEGAGIAGLTGVIARLAATSAISVRAIEDCVVPNCKNLSQFGKDLAELNSAASTAAMLAYIIAAVEDPIGTANDTIAVTRPMVDTVVRPLVDLISNGRIKLP